MRNASIAALLAAVVLIALPVAAAEQCERATLQGRVVVDDSPLPGATITLTCGDVKLTQTTDVDGKYAFQQVPVGRCALDLELDGLTPVHRDIDVVEGANDHGADAMAFESSGTAMACSFSLCSDVPAATPTDYPSCAEYELNSALIEACKERNDASAIALLETRMHETVALYERNRIAGALLGTRADAEAWKLLAADAELAVRFPQPDVGQITPEFEAWCKERGLSAADYLGIFNNALGEIAADKRSHYLFVRALSTDDWILIPFAISALGQQHDESVLPKVEELIARAPDRANRQWLLDALADFQSEAADAIALKYADERTRAAYLAQREQR